MKPFRARIRRILAAGLLVLVPVSFTFFLVYKLVQWTDNLLHFALPLPRFVALPGLGLLFLLGLVFVVGLATTNLVGRKVVEFGERILKKIPVVSSIYVGAKTLVEAFTIPTASAFRQVALVEYPRKGVWALGFVTKEVNEGESGIAGPGKLNVFIPTSPNPTSGMVIVVDRDDAMLIDLSVKEAVEFIVSGGVLYPSGRWQVSDKLRRREPVPWPEVTRFAGLSTRIEGSGRLPDPRSV